MKNTSLIWAGIIVLVLLIATGAYAYMHIQSLKTESMATTTASTSGTVAQYSCSEGALTAAFSNASVTLTLPDKRTFVLAQAVSGSGFRYETGTTVFAGKGSNATLTENGTVTYGNCLAGTNTSTGQSGDTNAGMKTFTDSSKTFSFMYPGEFTVTGGGASYTNGWSNNSSQLGLILAQVVVPPSFQPSTNFGDSRFQIGTSADATAVKDCLANPAGSTQQPVNVTINGVKYVKTVAGDAGAGNLYETTMYRTVRNSQCYSVEYTIHSTQLANYPASAGITAFDHAKVQALFEGMVQSVRFL